MLLAQAIVDHERNLSKLLPRPFSTSLADHLGDWLDMHADLYGQAHLAWG